MTISPTSPYVVMTSSAQVTGKARQYGRYVNIAVVQTDGAAMPAMISNRAKHMVRIVWHSGACSVGKTARSQSGQALIHAEALCAHLNRLHQIATDDSAPALTPDEIDRASNEEFRRQLIDAFGGLDAYLRAGAEVLDRDEFGVLVRRETNSEAVVAVWVTCPSTGRVYALRVPPTMRTAREAVAWSFDVPPSAYAPTAQS